MASKDPIARLKARLIARRVAKGNNPEESATMLAEILDSPHSDEQKARDLVYRDFATEAQARSAIERFAGREAARRQAVAFGLPGHESR